jgi:RHS repeat-associated protein
LGLARQRGCGQRAAGGTVAGGDVDDREMDRGANSTTCNYLTNSPLVDNLQFKQNGTLWMTTTKSYDNLNRLTQMSSTPSASGQPPVAFNYQYNSASQRTNATTADGSFWVYQYDALGQVIYGIKYWSDGTVVAGQQFGYVFDDIGNRKRAVAGGDQNELNWHWANYNVNSLNQYIRRSVPPYVNILGSANSNATVTVNNQIAYRKGDYYRAELNVINSTGALWLTVTNLAVLNSGTNADIVATNMGNVYLPTTPESFGYDQDGNLANDGRWDYTWDGEARLIGLTANTTTGPEQQISFIYDAQGRRIQKVVSTNNGTAWVPASTNRYVYDGWNLIAELNGNNKPVRSYVWGTDLSGTMQGAGGVSGLLEVSYYGTQTTNCFAAYDGNGNVAALVNAADGTVAAQYEYGPFGEVIRATGPMAKANPFRFSTKYDDDETDLLYYGNRYYIPSTGRWLSRDPIEERGGQNMYAFLRNTPLNDIDAFGLCGDDPFGDVFCGKDVTTPLNRVLDEVNSKFDWWGGQVGGRLVQDSACQSLVTSGRAENAWDIHELKIMGGEDLQGCNRQVTFNGRCYFGSAANYAMFGRAMAKCQKAFPKYRYSLPSAIARVIWYKMRHARGGFFDNPEAMQAVPFTVYGYNYGSYTSGSLSTFTSQQCAPDSTPDTRVFTWRWIDIKTTYQDK